MMLYIWFFVIFLICTYLPQWWVKKVLNQYNQTSEDNFPGTGGELARHILNKFQLQNIKVEVTDQGDHYDPEHYVVRLTKDKFYGKTLTAITVAAHECGHAMQHAIKQPSFVLRTRLAKIGGPIARIGSFLLFLAPFLTLFLKAPIVGLVSAIGAFFIMGFGILIQLITLPVELDASFNKALPLLKEGYLKKSQIPASEKILRAAAWTYVASSLGSLLNFWRWMTILRR
tara:strand:- start:14552 stop:15238 length:687 start_codon:yes stop_codon:yes gene_type:complete